MQCSWAAQQTFVTSANSLNEEGEGWSDGLREREQLCCLGLPATDCNGTESDQTHIFIFLHKDLNADFMT